MQKKILLYTETWSTGGIEAFALDEIESFSNDPVSFTVFSVWKHSSELDKRLSDLDVETIFCREGEEPSLVERCLIGWKSFDKLLSREHFDIVHVNTMNGAGLMYARIAKRHGVPIVVAHSRSTNYSEGFRLVKGLVHNACKAIAGSAPNVRLACSEEAGRYLFGKRPFSVIRRGLNVGKYAYDSNARKAIRNELGIPSDAFVIGNVGRVAPEKNALFQVSVFDAYHRLDPSSLFLLIGNGIMRAERDAEIEKLGIASASRIIDATSNTAPYYSAMDCLIMPSLFEGLPNVALEAQCSGMPVILTDTITTKVHVTDLVYTCSLEAGPDAWANIISTARETSSENRRPYAEILDQKGFSNTTMLHELRSYYHLNADCSTSERGSLATE